MTFPRWRVATCGLSVRYRMPPGPRHSARVPPLLLLDVDGVLNALGRPLPDTWPTWRTGTAVALGRPYVIAYSPDAVRRLLALHETGAAEVQWLTTWGHAANTSLRRLLSMPELAVAATFGAEAPTAGGAALADVTPAAPDALTGRWWKFDAVRQLLATWPGRRLVWLDDDLAGEPDIAAWTRGQTDALLIAPDPRVGLTPADLDRVEAFL